MARNELQETAVAGMRWTIAILVGLLALAALLISLMFVIPRHL